MYTFDFIISDAHPCLEGHFSGNPIVPGVIIIDEVISGVFLKKQTLEVTDIPSLKFLSPLKPNVKVTVNVSEKKTDLLKFVCSSNENILVDGLLRVRQVDEK